MKRNFEDIEDISQRIHTIPEELPVLPVRDAVIFPNAVIPLNVGRESSVKLINDVQQGDGMLVVLTQRDKRVDSPAPSDLYEIGTVSMVHRAMKTPEGNLFLIIMGVARVRVEEFTQFEPYLRGRIKTVQDEKEDENSVDFQALRRTVVSQFERIVKLSPQLPDDLQTIVINMEDSSRLADYIATNLPNLSIVSKQFALERSSVRDRLDFLHTELAKELEVLELRSKIQSQVQEEVGKSQREYFLREQLRAIQRELGESDDTQREIEELRQKVEASGMPEEARKEADRELGRLSRMSPAAAEYTVSRSYLDWLVALPWNVLTTERIDLIKAKDVLNRDHYDLDKIKERILEYLAVIQLKPGGKAPILCFVGPPGVGKTSLGRSIADAMGRKFVRVSLGGMRDEAEIRGHRRTYIGALPGQVIQNIRRAGSRDPVFMLDEIDKLGSDFRGDPASALLEVLDPEQNSTFRDHYLDVAFDLSRVFFITTANVLDTVPSALRDRMEVIELPGYTEEEKLQIARQYLVPRGRENNGLTPEQIEFEDAALSMIVRHYTRETGVRNLEREISGICRKQARRMLEGKGDRLTVTREIVEEFLGLPRYRPEEEVEERVNRPGVVLGLAWTPVGGDVLFVEANISKGARHLTVTGQIGEVMQESTKAALTWVRSKAKELGLDTDFYKDMDIHVHVPAGSIPKDGPSAGVTMVTAIASALTNNTIKPRLAMTGEITLSGHVLPVGGIKEKVLAARRTGIRELILPLQNQKNVQEDIQPELLKDLKIHYVRTIEEVLNLAFPSPVLSGVHQPHSTPQVV
jgi:ATP-dependent Lon protease